MEEENNELEELEALTESDEESEIETGDANKITFSEPAKRSQSIFELIYNTMNYPLFFFNVGYRAEVEQSGLSRTCLLYTSPSPRDRTRSRMPSSA